MAELMVGEDPTSASYKILPDDTASMWKILFTPTWIKQPRPFRSQKAISTTGIVKSLHSHFAKFATIFQ